jgi:anti-anti-sigma factor
MKEGPKPVVEYEVSERRNDHVVLKLRGELGDEVQSERLKESLELGFVDDGVTTIRVDVSELRWISLEGVGIILDLWRESRGRGKQLVVEEPSGQVREKLQVTGLLGVLTDRPPPST